MFLCISGKYGKASDFPINLTLYHANRCINGFSTIIAPKNRYFILLLAGKLGWQSF